MLEPRSLRMETVWVLQDQTRMQSKVRAKEIVFCLRGGGGGKGGKYQGGLQGWNLEGPLQQHFYCIWLVIAIKEIILKVQKNSFCAYRNHHVIILKK